MNRTIMIMAVLSVVLIAGCQTVVIDPILESDKQESFDPGEDIKTESFGSVAEYNAFIKQFENNGGVWRDVRSFGATAVDMVMDEVAESAPMVKSVQEASGGADGGSNAFSETNNQVVSVDEADIIKTDGDYIYTVSNSVLYVVKAYPGEDASVVSTIDFEDNRPSSIFVSGDKLAVFGNFYDNEYFKKIDIKPKNGMSFFNVYDISEKDDPELVKEYKFEGNYFNARMMDDWVYFVTQSSPVFRKEYPTPIIIEDDIVGSVPIGSVRYYNLPYNSPQFVNVHSISMADAESKDSVSVIVEGGQNMYMSEENIFITYTEWVHEWDIRQDITMDMLESQLSDSDKELIAKIEATDGDILSKPEKESKIFQIYSEYLNYMPRDERDAFEDELEENLEKKLEEFEHMEFTVINKIGVDDGRIEVKDSGKVPGHVINQFSMDEDTKLNVLRIGTTISSRWSSFGKSRSESANNIYALDASMEIIGELEGLAEGERIYSTRFVGDKLYMVTFKQVDPFFVIDLSDPTDIKNLGELKIPGFSNYLHPYDENTIIGIGQDASSSGRAKGLKISLFDVSDFEDPKEIAKFVADERYSQSTAQYEHKAFLFNREKELLVIPAYSRNWENPEEAYNGAFVFKITKDEIDLRGLIDHSSAVDSGWYQPKVERSLWIEDLLYTKSPSLLRINDLEDLHSVKNVTLQYKNPKIDVY